MNMRFPRSIAMFGIVLVSSLTLKAQVLFAPGGQLGTTNPATYPNVGIGTSTPEATFDVRGSALVGGSDIALGKYDGRNQGANLGNRALAHTDWGIGTDNLVININGDFEGGVHIDGPKLGIAGNVGIGTVNPLRKLHMFDINGYCEALWEVGAMNGALDGRIWRIGTNPEGGFAIQAMKGELSGGITVMGFLPNGNVGIGPSSPYHRLSVDGTIRAKEIVVETGWADHVFGDDYRLAPLSEVDSFIKENKHLPGIPSAAEVSEKGVGLGEMQVMLLAKVEELTLHLIELKKENATMRTQIESLKTTAR